MFVRWKGLPLWLTAANYLTAAPSFVTKKKKFKTKKGVGEHPRSVRILNVCWLTGRSLRARRSVRPRKGDSREISGIENA